jgi:PadR family transcriptional regulator PadR
VKQTQLLKGVLEGCVLAIIKEKTIYGYELVQALREAGFTDMVGGTVYPDGPNRKYYSLTSLGEERLLEFQEQWDYLTTHVDQILTNTNKEF